MRVALGILLSAVVLIAGAATGALGSWGLAAGGFVLVLGTIVGAVVLEEPELATTDQR